MSEASAAAPAVRLAAKAWMVVVLLWPVAALNYLDRQMVAAMRTSIRADIPSIANDADFGFLMSLFLWVYACLSPAGGYLADRFNRRWAVILSLAVWSCVTWLTGHAETFTQMAWARALMGVSEACYIPAALALIADFHPGPTRARAIGLHLSGIYAGQALGGVGGFIADTSTWRNSYYWFGLAGIGYAVVLLLFLPDAPSAHADDPGMVERHRAAREGVRIPAMLRELFGIGSYLVLVICFTLPGIPGWAVKNWLPTHLATSFGLKQGPAGLSATGYVTIASFFGVLLSGVLADRLMAVTPRARIYLSACGTALCVPALLGLSYAPGITSAIGFMILFGLGFGLFDANNMPILCQLVRRDYRATGYGIMNFAGIGTGGFITWAMGALRDHHISLSVAFLASAGIAAVSSLLVLTIRPRDSKGLEGHS